MAREDGAAQQWGNEGVMLVCDGGVLVRLCGGGGGFHLTD